MRRTKIGGIVLAAVALAGCQKQQTAVSASEAVPVRVNVMRIEAQPFHATVPVTGTLVSSSRVDVKAETTGRVVKFPKEEGETVAAGETVAWVDEENYRLAVRQAESAVQVAEAALARARVTASYGGSELERARNLVRSGGITDKDLKAAELAEQDSRAQTSLAVAQLDQAKAALDTARKHLRDTAIRALVAGEIQKKYINAGAYVEPTTAVFALVDNRRLELESQVASSDLAPIRPGQKATFTVNSYPGQTFEGRVIEINPGVDADTRSAKVRIQASNEGGRLKSGMFAQGEILTGVEARAIIIPAPAVYRDDRSAKTSYVFVVENGKAARREVRIGRERDSNLEIVAGLKPGDALISEQSIELAEGVRVAPLSGGVGK
ncbi:MAG: efflux RND transporter periplasmic adaptor subunit [Bryobacteraceae bacterium]|jgi:RND family efflux transporter MFP subunit